MYCGRVAERVLHNLEWYLTRNPFSYKFFCKQNCAFNVYKVATYLVCACQHLGSIRNYESPMKLLSDQSIPAAGRRSQFRRPSLPTAVTAWRWLVSLGCLALACLPWVAWRWLVFLGLLGVGLSTSVAWRWLVFLGLLGVGLSPSVESKQDESHKLQVSWHTLVDDKLWQTPAPSGPCC